MEVKKLARSKSTPSNTANFAEEPLVYKVDDFNFFIECVEDGLWQNSSYLGELCSVNRETIGVWKKTKIAKEARKKASKALRRDFRGRGDIDKRLSEAGFDVTPTKVQITHVIPILGGLSNVQIDDGNSEAS